MKFLKILMLFALSMFLISNASALVSYAEFSNGNQQATINHGDSISFTSYFLSQNPPMTINVKLYDTSNNLIYTFENAKVVSGNSYYSSYTIDSSVYGARKGNLKIISSGVDALGSTPPSDTSTIQLTINDVTAPVLTLNGATPVNVQVNTAYTDAGATATDNVDGSITPVVTGTVNTAVIGTYTLTYTATDSSGNIATATRTVNVADTTAPTITLTGSNPQMVLTGVGTYVEQGATATDNYDTSLPAITIDSSSVNTLSLGTYTVTYTVTDSSGNTATATRTVNVVSAITAPVIVVSSPVNAMIYDSAITNLQFTVTDDDLTSCQYSTNNGATKTSIACSSGNLVTVAVNSVEGTNTWIVYAADSAGNNSTTTVVFFVNTAGGDSTPPIITVFSPKASEKYTDKDVLFKITTNEDATVWFKLDGGANTTMDNPSDNIYSYTKSLSDGTHTVVFYARDSQGNEASKSITFKVDTKGASKKTISPSGDSSGTGDETDYINQYTPKVIKVETEEKQLSLIQRIIQAIINFLKRLFGLE